MAKNITIGVLGIIVIILSLSPFILSGTKAYDPTIGITSSTTNATPTTIYTLPIATGEGIRIGVDILGKSGNNYYAARKAALVKNVSGTLSVVGANVADIFDPIADPTLNSVTCDITFSGTNLIVVVTGIAATTINWRASITYLRN